MLLKTKNLAEVMALRFFSNFARFQYQTLMIELLEENSNTPEVSYHMYVLSFQNFFFEKTAFKSAFEKTLKMS